eukprot:845870-Prymnesium_polylepis.1
MPDLPQLLADCHCLALRHHALVRAHRHLISWLMFSEQHEHLITPAVRRASAWLEEDQWHGRDCVEDMIKRLCTVCLTPTPPEVIAARSDEDGQRFDARLEQLRSQLARLDELEDMYEEPQAQTESLRAEPDPSRLLAAACHISSALARAWRGYARRSLTN